jgi:hypothetical protein
VTLEVRRTHFLHEVYDLYDLYEVLARVTGFGVSSYQVFWKRRSTWLLWYEPGFVPPSRAIGFGRGCVRVLRTRADRSLG